MSRKKLLRLATVSLVTLSLLLGLVGRAANAAPTSPNRAQSAVARLSARAGAPLSAQYDARYGTVTFLLGGLPYAASASVQGDALAIALEFLAQNPDLYGMDNPAAQLALVRTTSDELGQVHVRLQQTVNGVPVFGRSIYVHLDAHGNVLGTNGHFVPAVRVDTQATLSSDSAAQIALRAAGTSTAKMRMAKLVVYLDKSDTAFLAWQIEVVDLSVPARTLYFVGARGGQIIHTIEILATGKDRVIYDAQNSTDSGVQVGQEGEAPSDKAARAAYDNSGKVYDYYSKNHARDSYDANGGQLVSIVHFGEQFENAFWDGQQMVYGDGDTAVTKPYPFSFDVAAHELTHAVTEYSANLVYESQSGALNESYSDVLASTAEAAVYKFDEEDNWTIGEEIWNGDNWPTPFLRSLSDPSLGGNYNVDDVESSFGQPSKMSEYANLPVDRQNDNGGVHTNSGIPNHTAYLVAQNVGGGKNSFVVVEKIWYRALTTYLTDSSEFSDFATATLTAAEDLFGKGSKEAQAVTKALDEVELSASDTQPTPPAGATPRKGGPTPVPQATPNKDAGCTELIKDGGFEKGSSDLWFESTLPDAYIIADSLPHGGKLSAWMGGTDDEQYAFHYIYQELKIPANAKVVTLNYFHNLHTEYTNGKAPKGDPTTFGVVLANEDGDVLDTLETITSKGGDDKWTSSALNLKKFAGKTVRVAFTAQMTKGDISSLFVDDVSLVSCTSDKGAPATPPPSGGGGGYTVGGTITDYNTGNGIEGATVFFLKPGTSATEASTDGKVTKNEVFTFGITDGDGQYQLEQELAAGETYSVIVIAEGYYAIIADDAVNTDDFGDQHEIDDLDGEMQPVE